MQYSCIQRSTAQGSWCDSSNAVYLSGTLTLSVPAQPPAPYQGKTIYDLSGWSAANCFWHDGANWVTAPMCFVIR